MSIGERHETSSLDLCGLARIPITSVGNQDLNETSVDAYELGYSGVVAQGRAIVSVAFYVNKTKDDIFFTEVPNSGAIKLHVASRHRRINLRRRRHPAR